MQSQWWEIVIAGNRVVDYLTAGGIALAAWLGLKIAEKYAVSWLKRLASKTKLEFDDLVINILDSLNWVFYLIVSVYVGVQFITLNPFVRRISDTLTAVVVGYFVIRGLEQVSDYLLIQLLGRSQKDDSQKKMILSLAQKLARFLIWVIAGALILQNLGYKVGALLGGLGIGGIAVAFALQNVLEDVFAYFSIYFDKPFQIGDFIVAGQDKGRVEYIGIKTTRLRTLQGEELIISNKDLTNARVSNFKRMQKRRVVTNLGVAYETPPRKLQKIPQLVEKILSQHPKAEFNRCYLVELADYALRFEIVYHVTSKDYQDYLEIQQLLNLELLKQLAKLGVEIAYPTQTIHLRNQPDNAKNG